jgi:hypothetical protein
MANPQQPEIARSRRGDVVQDSVKERLTVPQSTETSGDVGVVPEDNLPGHHPEHEQDKPTGEQFLRKLHEHAQEAEAATEEPAPAPTAATGTGPEASADDPEPTVAGDALRAAAGLIRKVRESLPGA